MPAYIVSGRSESGRTVTRMIKATTAQDALDIMRSHGCSDLLLHTDDLLAVSLEELNLRPDISAAEVMKQSYLSAFRKLRRYCARILLICTLILALILVAKVVGIA